jgi:Asp-tRNA(Asn)/Glu-tRNA(Gln) amidotransferase C subunit
VLSKLFETLRVLSTQGLGSSAAMSRLFASDYTISEYRLHLNRLLGFFEPLECAASLAAQTEGSVQLLQRSSDLREDLRNMGATAQDIDAIERCQRLPPSCRLACVDIPM